MIATGTPYQNTPEPKFSLSPVTPTACRLDLTGTMCSHFDEDTFEGELMTGYVDDASSPRPLFPGCE